MCTIIIDSIISLVKNSAKGLIGFIVLWILGGFLERLLHKNMLLLPHHRGVVEALARTLKYFCIFLGIIVFLKDMGVDLQGVITGLGLTGFSLGFALKDTISNVVAGTFILMYRPFHLGDEIIVSTDKILAEGKVLLIDFRYTVLETERGNILIPNSILYTNIITLKK